jgi:glycine dehydrogenase subunit 2
MSRARRAGSHISLNEPLLFEESSAGRRAFDLPALDIPERDLDTLIPRDLCRDDLAGMPELSESDVVRHFTRLSSWNYSIDLGLYPLGSCTMKYNPRINECIARMRGFTATHPYMPPESIQGALQVQKTLEDCLAEITGMQAVSLQPAAGAQGELMGLLLIRAYHEAQGMPRKTILVPDSAHGTNPASVAISGYEARRVQSGANGALDLAHLETLVDEDVAGIMITNPNTLGIFESEIEQVTALLHSKGALVYMDGANLNAIMGVTRPGDFGVDVLHLNLHKTFSTPHGGGGPGSGPVAVGERLEPYLPNPIVVRHEDGSYSHEVDRPQSIGRVKAFTGQFGMHVRALAYILANGAAGLREVSETAVLNANYLRKKLEGRYHLPYTGRSLHEVVFSDRFQRKNGVTVGDIGKRLIDYGFHPPTVSFPLIVSGAIMIEPTETESRQELDAFIEAMLQIADEAETDPDKVKTAPHNTRIGQIDEASAARKPILRWQVGEEEKSLDPESTT